MLKSAPKELSKINRRLGKYYKKSKRRSKRRSNRRSNRRSKKKSNSKGEMGYHWFVKNNKENSNNKQYSKDENSEIKRMKNQSKEQGEQLFAQMMVNDYICKNKTWEQLQKDFRPSGSMSLWTIKLAKLLGLKTNTNYNPILVNNSKSISRGKLKKHSKKHSKKKHSKKTKYL